MLDAWRLANDRTLVALAIWRSALELKNALSAPQIGDLELKAIAANERALEELRDVLSALQVKVDALAWPAEGPP
jgi:hypothetical protein